MQKLNRSETFKYAHMITKAKDVAYYGGYQKAFAMVLKNLYSKGGLVWSWNV